MDPFVEQLKDCCRRFPTRAKWVFVPTHAVGHTLGERLVLEGTNWLNLRFVTPLDIALRMGAPFLVERGIDPSEEELGPVLMMRLLLELPADGGYFRPLAGHPTLAQALWTTVRELRMAGLSAKDLKRSVFTSPIKHPELVTLMERYEAFLDARKRADMATVYHEAMRHLDWCPIQAADLRTELPDANWTPLQRALIDALPGEVMAPRVYQLAGLNLPRRLEMSPTVRVAPARQTAPLANLMSPAASLAAADIALFHAGGREAEIEEVFRRILASGTPLDQIEIACASDAHVPLIWEKAQRHDWPVTLGTGIPCALTRPGRALAGLCDWIETEFAAGHFRRLLQSGDLKVEDQHGFNAARAARVLARAEAGWGRNTYQLSLTRLIKDREAAAIDADTAEQDRGYFREQAAEAASIRAWTQSLVDSIPVESEAGTVPVQEVVVAALDFLEHRVARSNALDHRAAAALAEYVTDLRALGAFECPLSEALRFIRERIESLTVAPERPRPGHLFVCTLSNSVYAGRSRLFVVGLEEGRVFSSSNEDPILLDEEREKLSAGLRRSNDRVDEAVHAVIGRLAVASGRATFSYSCRDTREFRETFASWLMLQAYRVQQGNAALSYQDLKKALGEPVSAVPVSRDAAVSKAGWWLRSITGTSGAGVAAVGASFPSIAHGLEADANRDSGEPTAHDGYVPGAGPVLDPAKDGIVYSVTELEKAAECPFRFFVKRGLGIRPVDERERDRDIWLDPLTRGSALHEVYAAYLRKVRDEKRRPDMADEPWLRGRVERILKALDEEMPAPTDEVRARETRDFVADVSLFLEAEVADPSRTAVGLEVSFGRPTSDDDEAMASEKPAAIELAPGVKLRFAGRIDRINEVAPSTFEVLDYKTGGYFKDDWKGTFAGGTRLQHALYGLAVVGLLKATHDKPRVKGGSYYFSSTKGGSHRVEIAAPSHNAVAKVLSDLRDVIAGGHFLRTPHNKKCTFCDFGTLCGEHTNQQAETKRAHPAVEPITRLAAHA